MDKDRQIRFLYPPLIFISSIAFGIWLDNSGPIKGLIAMFFKNDNNTNIAVTLLGLSSIIIIIGFILGTLTMFILRLLFFRNNFIYELKLDEKTYKQIGERILKNKNDTILKKDRFYAGVVFDHGFISDRLHGWVTRRWNSFIIACSSTLGLFASLIVGRSLAINFTLQWLVTVVSLIFIFILQARLSWLETMRMIAFMTRVKSEGESDLTNKKV